MTTAPRVLLGLIVGAIIAANAIALLGLWMGKPITGNASACIYAIWGLFGATMGFCGNTSDPVDYSSQD